MARLVLLDLYHNGRFHWLLEHHWLAEDVDAIVWVAVLQNGITIRIRLDNIDGHLAFYDEAKRASTHDPRLVLIAFWLVGWVHQSRQGKEVVPFILFDGEGCFSRFLLFHGEHGVASRCRWRTRRLQHQLVELDQADGTLSFLGRPKVDVEGDNPQIDMHTAGQRRSPEVQLGTNLDRYPDVDEPDVDAEPHANGYSALQVEVEGLVVDEEVGEGIKPGFDGACLNEA